MDQMEPDKLLDQRVPKRPLLLIFTFMLVNQLKLPSPLPLQL